MAYNKEKVKYLWFGEKAPMDTTIKTVNVNNIIISSIFFGCIFYFLSIVVLWRDLPFLSMNQGEHNSLYFAGGLFKWTLGWFLPFLDSGNRSFSYWLLSLRSNTEIAGVIGRAFITYGVTLYGLYIGYKFSNVPTGGEKHVKGKILLKAKEAYNDLKKEFDFLSNNGRGARLVVATEKPFNPETDYIDNLKPGTYIELPEKLRRSHSMYVASTGRGKTQLIMYREVQQVHRKIAAGEVCKMMICDTPKSDYSRVFADKNVYRIAPHEEGSIAWNIAEDLTDGLLAAAFWKGKIPVNDSDPIWGNAAITVGTGCTRFLQVVAPKAWNYGMLAHLLTKNGEFLEPILSEHYPEAKQILGAAGETISSVMFNLGSYTADFISLARIYDGFEIKKPIFQATAKALKHRQYVEYVYKDMFNNNKPEPGKEPQHLTKCIMFKGVCLYLNSNNPNWTWVNFAEFVQQHKYVQVNLVSPYLRQEDEAKLVNGLFHEELWKDLSKLIVEHAKAWDELETVKKLSIRDWLVSNNPARKILLLKPSETYPTLTEGLIKGILYYANSVILGGLKDDKKRRFHIIIDELQSYGNIEPFLGPALALYRSRGVSITLAFQDLSQLVKIYGQEFVDFINSNIGNINILGVNDGFTANKFTELLGEKKITKLHKTKTPEGKNSENLQEHEEKVVYANEWNLLGANEALMKITYINLIGGLNPAYTLEAPILDYKVRSEQVRAKWIDEGFETIVKDECLNFDEYWEGRLKKSDKQDEEENFETEIKVFTDFDEIPVENTIPIEKLIKTTLKDEKRREVLEKINGEENQ